MERNTIMDNEKDVEIFERFDETDRENLRKFLEDTQTTEEEFFIKFSPQELNKLHKTKGK
jgi:type III secretory pathway component EscR